MRAQNAVLPNKNVDKSRAKLLYTPEMLWLLQFWHKFPITEEITMPG